MLQYSFLAAAVPNSVAVEETAAASDAKGAVRQIEPNAAAAVASRKTKVNDHRQNFPDRENCEISPKLGNWQPLLRSAQRHCCFAKQQSGKIILKAT